MGRLVFEEIRDLKRDAQDFSVEERKATAEWLRDHSRLSIYSSPVEAAGYQLEGERWTAALIVRAEIEIDDWTRYITERRRENSSLDARRHQWNERRRGMIFERRNRLFVANEEVPTVDQVRAWEHDEVEKMEQGRLANVGTGRHLDHLTRTVPEQEVRETDQVNEGIQNDGQNDYDDHASEMRNYVDRNGYDGLQGDQVSGTGGRTLGFTGVVRQRDKALEHPRDRQVSSGLLWT
jgi:hypothetical protein